MKVVPSCARFPRVDAPSSGFYKKFRFADLKSNHKATTRLKLGMMLVDTIGFLNVFFVE